MADVSRLRVVRPGQQPDFELLGFSNTEEFQESWAKTLSPGHDFLTDHFWRLRDDQDLRVASAVGKVMFGIISSYPEFSPVGTSIGDGSYIEDDVVKRASYFTVVARQPVHLLNPETTFTSLVEATNESLLALNSAYHLPLE